MSRFAAAAWVAALSALAAAQGAHSAFGFRPDGLWLTRFSGPLPAFAQGPSAAFDNPAALAGVPGHEIRMMASDFTHPLTLSAAYAGHFQNIAAFGLAHGFSNDLGRRENRSVVSFASTGGGLGFGANLKSLRATGWPPAGYDSSLFVLDADAGLLVTLWEKFSAAAAIFNLLSPSAVETENRTLYPERSAKFSLGLRLGARRETAFFGEARMDSLHGGAWAGLGAGGGAEKRWALGGLFEARAGYFWYRRSGNPTHSGLMGLSFWPALGQDRFGVEYGLRVGNNDAAHFFLMGVHLGGEGDGVPPTAEAGSDIEYLTPNGDGKNDRVNFLLTARDDSQGKGVKKWSLTVYRNFRGKTPKPVKSFSGTGLPPRAIEWDGRDAGHRVVPPGTYYYELRVVDFSNNEGKSGAQALHVN